MVFPDCAITMIHYRMTHKRVRTCSSIDRMIRQFLLDWR